MPVDPAHAGRTYPPTPPYEVGREKLREFAAAVGENSPACHDVDAARALGHRDLIAAPTFAIVLAQRADAAVITDPEVGIDFSRVVHGEQRFAYSRPITAGDVLICTTTIASVRSAGGHDMVTTRGEIATVDGEHVCTATSTIVVRGEGS
jgi:acyl dehydratase